MHPTDLPMSQRIFNVLNLGAGLQSSRVLLGSCRGELPRFDAAVFADTGWEPKAVYENVQFLKGEAQRAGIPVVVVSCGASIREEALQFARQRKHAGQKHYASLPLFIKNRDGTQGRMKRQCTKEYKIEVIEKWIRRELLGMRLSQRIPSGILVRQWFGISDDEASRATYPGVYRTKKLKSGTDLFGKPLLVPLKKWVPATWRHNVYPLLNEVWLPDRTIVSEQHVPRREQRWHCFAWLKGHYPGRKFPRSACLGCPYRSNEEWRDMRDNRPDEWEDACAFDDAQRQLVIDGAAEKHYLVGVPYVHRQMVPLRMADLGGEGEKGGGCGALHDGMDGLCDV